MEFHREKFKLTLLFALFINGYDILNIGYKLFSSINLNFDFRRNELEDKLLSIVFENNLQIIFLGNDSLENKRLIFELD